MFCSHCGVKASGNFCFQCGKRLHGDAEVVTAEEDSPVPAAIAWELDPSYENVVAVKEVRAVIASHAKQACPGLSAEQFFDMADKIVPVGVSYSGLAAIAQPLWASWGVRTGKERTELLPLPIGVAIARTMCTLARNKQNVEGVEQHSDGCTIAAELPSSVWAMKGELKVRLVQHEHGTQVTAATNIPGQAFDWGKSIRCLGVLFTELQTDLGLPQLKAA
ncbi:hypothetical protein [Blastopirellula marina]|uniref:Uncharacterized protein n=1 Tax=Blastopirellula marina TaxID=124 RepID=A0A2S8F877_9BACT|nr:hypothetical protein [Blastopirellula marina]PQO28366.1 hypothetical protein C5Y98_26090 [Blastopirellula marina]PTL41906.1 hypothetical protein C5Y97_26105 [Blastopirellula marina]